MNPVITITTYFDPPSNMVRFVAVMVDEKGQVFEKSGFAEDFKAYDWQPARV